MFVHNKSKYLKVYFNKYLKSGTDKIYLQDWNLATYESMYLDLNFSNFSANEVIDNFVLIFPLKSIDINDFENFFEKYKIENLELLFNVYDEPLDFSNRNYGYLFNYYSIICGRISIGKDGIPFALIDITKIIKDKIKKGKKIFTLQIVSNCFSLNKIYDSSINEIKLDISDNNTTFNCNFHYEQNEYKNYEEFKLNNNITNLCDLRNTNDAFVVDLYNSNSDVNPLNLALFYRPHNLQNHIGNFIPSWYSFISKKADDNDYISPITITDYLGNKNRYYYFTEEEKKEINYKFSSNEINTTNIRYYYNLSNESKIKVEKSFSYYSIYLTNKKGCTVKFKYFATDELSFNDNLLMIEEVNDNGFITTFNWVDNLLTEISNNNKVICTFKYNNNLLTSIYHNIDKIKIEFCYNDENNVKTISDIKRGFVLNPIDSINVNQNMDLDILINFNYHQDLQNYIISEIKDRIIEQKYQFKFNILEYDEENNTPLIINKKIEYFESCKNNYIKFENYDINIEFEKTFIYNKYNQVTKIYYDEFIEKEFVENNNNIIFYAYDQISPTYIQPTKIATIFEREDNLLKNGELNYDEQYNINYWSKYPESFDSFDNYIGNTKYDDFFTDKPINFVNKYTPFTNYLLIYPLTQLVQSIDIKGCSNDEYELFCFGKNNNEFLSPLKVIVVFYKNQVCVGEKEFRFNSLQQDFQFLIKNFITECMYDNIKVKISYDGYNETCISYISLRKVKEGTTQSYNISSDNGIRYINNNKFSALKLDSENEKEEIYVYNTNVVDKKRYLKSNLIEYAYNSFNNVELKNEYENELCVKEEKRILNEKILSNSYKYNSNNLLEKEIDDLGNIIEYVYINNRLDMVKYYLNIKYKYYYDINNYVVKISKIDNNDDFANECNIEYDGNKQVTALNEYDFPKFEFNKNSNGQIGEINLKLSSNENVLCTKYEYYDNINGCRNDLIKNKILYNNENQSEKFTYEYDNNNNVKKIYYNEQEKANIMYDDKHRVINVSVNECGEVYNNLFEYDQLTKEQLNKIIINNNEISFEYDNNNVESETLKINDKHYSYYYDYVEEVQDYNLLGYLGLINKNTLNDYLTIIGKFNGDNSENNIDEVYLTYANTKIAGNYIVQYDKKINHNVISINSSNDYLNIPTNKANSQRINNSYYHGMLYNKDKYLEDYEKQNVTYLWFKIDSNVNQNINLITIFENNNEFISLFLKPDGSLNLSCGLQECSTNLAINFNEWNFIGLNLNIETIEVYCNENKKIINGMSRGGNTENVFTLFSELVPGKYTSTTLFKNNNSLFNYYKSPIKLVYFSVGTDIFSDLKRKAIYLNGIKYLNEYKVTKTSGVSFYDSDLYENFEVFPLLGTFTSNKGMIPETCVAMNTSYSSSKARYFKYDEESKHHVFASYKEDMYQLQNHNQVVSYKIPFDGNGVITLWVKPDGTYVNEENRYLFDISGKLKISLSINNYLVIERKIELPEGSYYVKDKISRRLNSDEWNFVVISICNGLDIKVNSSVFYHMNVNLNINNKDILYLGTSVDSNCNSLYHLNGYIRMLAFSEANVLKDDNNIFDLMYSNGKIVNIYKNYDDYGRVNSLEICEGNEKLIHEYKFYDKPTKISPYITCEYLPNGNRNIYNYNEKMLLTHKVELDLNNIIYSVYFYKYNSINQLVEEYHYGYNNVFEYKHVYTYDCYGNILYKNVYNINDIIIYSYEYTYDFSNPYLLRTVKLNGNDVCDIEYNQYRKLYPSKITKDCNEYNLTWEGNKLTSFGNCSFKYNYDGSRTKLITSNYIKEFVTFNNKTYSVIKRLVNNPDEYVELIYIFDEQNLVVGFKFNNKYYYFEKDCFGNINKIIDINNTVYVEYKYDAYGKPTISIPIDLPNELISIAENISQNNIYIYKGYIYDVETSLFWLSSRYYSPELCRFISPDDVEYLDPESVNGLNLYCYCKNNPIMYTDPSGHLAFSVLLGIGIVVGAIIGGSVSVVSQGIENGWDNIDWRVVAVDAVFGAIDGALSVTGMGALASLAINPMLAGAQVFVTDLVTGDLGANTFEQIMVSMAFSMVMVGASSALSKFSPIKVGYDGINNAGIYNTSKGYIATAKSAKKIAMYKAKQSLVKKTILQGTGGYALFTASQNFTSWGLNQLLGW